MAIEGAGEREQLEGSLRSLKKASENAVRKAGRGLPEGAGREQLQVLLYWEYQFEFKHKKL